jgi:hypothetical protein
MDGYNEFVETFATARGLSWWEPFGMAPVRLVLAAQSPTAQSI